MESIEKNIAKQLLDINAVQLSPNNPFTWASGWKSPIYCDNRKILSYPMARKKVFDGLVTILKKNFPDVNCIAGVATGAIAYGIMVAEAMNLPFVYVRPKPKDHGTGAQIEGDIPQGARIVVIEDLISTGGSSLSAVDCLENSGANVLGMVAIFSYNFDKARKAFESANCELYTLTNYEALIEEAVATDYIEESQVDTLKKWRIDPGNWGI